MQPDSQGFFYVNQDQCVPDFFSYNIDFNTPAGSFIAAGAAVAGQFTVQVGQYFLWQQSVYSADTAQATLTNDTRLIPLCTVALTDTNSGKNLTNSPTMVPSLFGTAMEPFILPNPRLCMPQSIIGAQVANITAGVNYNLRLTFIGLALTPTGRRLNANGQLI